MTPSQKKAVERIRKMAERDLFFGGPEKYEFKKWEVEEFPTFVSLVLETGIKEDEGTMAVLVRDRAHLFIHRRGGVTYPVHTRRGSSERRWDGVTILTPVIDQQI